MTDNQIYSNEKIGLLFSLVELKILSQSHDRWRSSASSGSWSTLWWARQPTDFDINIFNTIHMLTFVLEKYLTNMYYLVFKVLSMI